MCASSTAMGSAKSHHINHRYNQEQARQCMRRLALSKGNKSSVLRLVTISPPPLDSCSPCVISVWLQGWGQPNEGPVLDKCRLCVWRSQKGNSYYCSLTRLPASAHLATLHCQVPGQGRVSFHNDVQVCFKEKGNQATWCIDFIWNAQVAFRIIRSFNHLTMEGILHSS